MENRRSSIRHRSADRSASCDGILIPPTCQELLTLKTPGWYHRQVEWSPDGNIVALFGGGGRLTLWRVLSLDAIQREDVEWASGNEQHPPDESST